MLFVLFAVVLILPAFQGEGFSSAAQRCYDNLMLGNGRTACLLAGYNYLRGLNYGRCQVMCDDDDNKAVQLPTYVCPNGRLPSTCTATGEFLKWTQEINRKKNDIVRTWCNCG
uniref:Putative conserved secreted protein n=1 Tax=Ixodes ricinus TaxID=34613 RepID=A0A6B0UJY6_IXORI